jgi:PAS domain S-box-containing protein
MTDRPSESKLAAELENLRAQMAEAEEVLRAIRNGEVDAVVVAGEGGERVHTLGGSDRLCRQLVETMGEGAAALSADGVILYCNAYLAKMLGKPLDHVLGTALRDYLRLTDRKALDAILAQAHTKPSRREVNLISNEGRLAPVYLSASRLRSEGAGTVFCLVLTDLTEHKCHERIVAAEAGLRRVNRALHLISLFNQEMVRATDEAALLQAACRLAVEQGGYRMAWVGFAEGDEAKSVRPVAQAGFDNGYLDTLNVTWADAPRGRGPTGTAIRTGQPVLARNIPTDSAFGPWRELADQRGYASSIALPLHGGGRCFGALSIYAAAPDAFDPEEAKLLGKLADDVAYGIEALRHRAQRERAAAKAPPG